MAKKWKLHIVWRFGFHCTFSDDNTIEELLTELPKEHPEVHPSHSHFSGQHPEAHSIKHNPALAVSIRVHHSAHDVLPKQLSFVDGPPK
jgi:hypothetical protein